MASPRPSNRESRSSSRRARLALLAGAGLLVALAGCWLIGRFTGTGAIGFGVALVGVLTLATGALCLREIRRVHRTVRRVEIELRRSRQETGKQMAGLGTRATETKKSLRATHLSVRDLGRTVTAQQGRLESITAVQADTRRLVAGSLRPDALQAQLATQLHQQQAMLNLFALVPVRDVVPTMGGWAASADVVALLVGELLRIRPRLAVECGSGVSTLWTALAIEHHGLDCRIISLDHDPYFAEQTRRSLRAHGVERHVEVRDAPLVPTELEGHPTAWYDPAALTGLEDIGLLFVDGPPDATGPLVRYPAVPLLRPRLAPTTTVVLDDLIRPGEKEVVARWRLQLGDFELQQLPLQKAAAVFRRVASPARD